MSGSVWEESLIILAIRGLRSGDYISFLHKWVDSQLKASKTSLLVRKLSNVINTCLESSLIGKVIEIDRGKGESILSYSLFANRAIRISNSAKRRVTAFFRNSGTLKLIDNSEKILFIESIRILGAIIVISVTTNLGLLILLKRDIGFIGAVVRSGFIFAGVSGLLCDASRADIRRSCLSLRFLRILGRR
ncbi:MAG: hypothetical protein ABID09_00095 [Candidatus Omnitrophota bacterium]